MRFGTVAKLVDAMTAIHSKRCAGTLGNKRRNDQTSRLVPSTPEQGWTDASRETVVCGLDQRLTE